MPRPQRIALSGAYYHVSHGVAAHGPAIFRSREDMASFFSLLEKAAQRFEVLIYAYCVLPQRYHLLIQTRQPNVHGFMRHLNSAYTQWLQRQAEGCGRCFEGRYQSCLLDAERYLAVVSVVIHRKAMAVTGEALYPQYRWSSMRAYLSKIEPPAWLHIGAVMEQVRDAHKMSCYADYAQCALPAAVQHFYKLKRRPQVLGDAAFAQQLASQSGRYAGQTIRTAKDAAHPVDLADIVHFTADYFHVSVAAVLVANRGKLNTARNVAIYLARMLTQASARAVAEYFGLKTHSAVSNVVVLMEQRRQQDDALAKACAYIEAQLSSSMASLAEGDVYDFF